jgi:hypothetical protein
VNDLFFTSAHAGFGFEVLELCVFLFSSSTYILSKLYALSIIL